MDRLCRFMNSESASSHESHLPLHRLDAKYWYCYPRAKSEWERSQMMQTKRRSRQAVTSVVPYSEKGKIPGSDDGHCVPSRAEYEKIFWWNFGGLRRTKRKVKPCVNFRGSAGNKYKLTMLKRYQKGGIWGIVGTTSGKKVGGGNGRDLILVEPPVTPANLDSWKK